MKKIFSIFLFCVIFGSAMTTELKDKMKLARIGLAIRHVVLNREKELKKLMAQIYKKTRPHKQLLLQFKNMSQLLQQSLKPEMQLQIIQRFQLINQSL